MPKPIIELQRRAQIVGELRMGEQVATGKGDNTRPASLAEWRLTSRDRELLQQVAVMYGGEVQPWDGNPGEWELYTKSSEIVIIVHPQSSVPSQSYEMWSKTGLLRRCGGTGHPCTVTDEDTGERKIVECFCDTLPEKEQCSLMTRFKFEIAGVPALGLWSFQTKGFNAAAELPAQVEMLLGKFNTKTLAVLAIEPRESEQRGQPKKKFKVPVLRYRPNLAKEVLSRGGVRDASQVDMLVVPAPVHALPTVSVAQSEYPVQNADVVSEQVGDYQRHQAQNEEVQDAVFVEDPGTSRTPPPDMTPEETAKWSYKMCGIGRDDVSELTEMLKKTGVEIALNGFIFARAQAGDSNVEEVKAAIKMLNPSAFTEPAAPPSESSEPDPFAAKPSDNPFATTQESLGGLG